jgi:membrane protease YdiL (CAAX protease family)
MLSEKPWKPEAVLRLFAGVFLCIFIGTLLTSLGRSRNQANDSMVIWRMVVAVLSFHGVALVLIWRFLHINRISWADAFGFVNHRKRAVLSGALAMLVFLPVGWGLQMALVNLMKRLHLEPVEQQAVQTLRDATGWIAQAALAGFAIVLAPLVEEMLFRGLLYPTIKQAGYPRVALWGTSLFFAVIHFNLPSFLPLLLLALLLTLLYEKTNNLLATITAHSLFNSANFALFYLSPWLEQKFKWLAP